MRRAPVLVEGVARGTPSAAYPLLALPEARRRLAALVLEPLGVERRAVPTALGAWPAAPVRAPGPVPRVPTSAMDGFALARPAPRGSLEFRLVPRRPDRLKPGEATAIATGAPLPRGATAVARLEAARVSGSRLRLAHSVPPGRDVHGAGAAIASGSVLARPDRPLDAYALAGLIAAHVREVRVRPLRITVLATGDELVRRTTAGVGPADAIGPWIAATASRWATVTRARPLPDDARRIRQALERASRRSDLLVTVGGSSVGPRDRTKRAVAEAGRLVFGGVRVNVLKRAGLGVVRKRPVVILPGQIESAVVSFHEFGLPLIGRWRGTDLRSRVRLRLARRFTVDHRMDSTVLFATRSGRAEPLGWGVTRYGALLEAEAFGYFRRGRTYRAGALLDLQRLIR